jgi:hypothetical protein
VWRLSLSLSLFFLGDEWKKLRIPIPLLLLPPDDEDEDEEPPGLDDTMGGGLGGGGTTALNLAIICGSRRTLRVSVNSSLLCSILRRRENE